MTTAERLQRAYKFGRDSAALQISEHIKSTSDALEEHDPVGAAALKYAAEFAYSICDQPAKYEEEE